MVRVEQRTERPAQDNSVGSYRAECLPTKIHRKIDVRRRRSKQKLCNRFSLGLLARIMNEEAYAKKPVSRLALNHT